MLYTIMSADEAYTLESESEVSACVATLLLGDGQYSLDTQEGTRVLPLFTEIEDAEAWLKEKFGITEPGIYMRDNARVLAKCLESIIVGTFEERRAAKDTRVIDNVEFAAQNIAARLYILTVEDTK